MNDSSPLEPIFALGLAAASASLSESTGAQLTPNGFRVRLAADFPDVAEADHVDVVAGVAQRFNGSLRGTAVFTMEPEGALALSRSVADTSEPAQVISTFVDLASGVLADLLRTAGQAMHGGPVEFDPASLREDSRVAIVIGTHAPGDTVIATLGLAVELDREAYSAHLDLLFEPKLLAGDWTAREDR